MLFKKTRARPPRDFPPTDKAALMTELSRRMDGVQRHRLLQGFPMAPMMPEAPRAPVLNIDKARRPLLVGVIPHTFCVPAVKGCGFCTFPHDTLDKRQMIPLAATIARRIGHRARLHPYSNVTGIYFGGGTANLTPLPALGILVGALAAFRTHKTEVTLEGVPRFFTAEQLDLLTESKLGTLRISMGVQTFDESWLQKMGRQNIGSPQQVADAVALAQQKSAGTSVDLLLNLPGQPRSAMLADVDHAIALGVDQVCLYHLVLRESLPVPWAKDQAMLDALPDNPTAYDNWRAARERLLEQGFTQRTLTNFERVDLPPERRFRYEPQSFRPHTGDALGFGPGAITGVNFGTKTRPLKWINHPTAEGYLDGGSGRHRLYLYDGFEDALMQLTRGLALLCVPLDEGALEKHRGVFAPELAVLQEAGLIEQQAADLHLTEPGMFYADSVAGLLAWRTVQYRKAVGLNEPDIHPMG